MKPWLMKGLALLITGGVIYAGVKITNTATTITESSYLQVDKPVIYLYPEKETKLSIKLSGAELVTTYPEYKDKWDITAYPDGTLIDINNRKYNYLFWEGKSQKLKIRMDEGFVIQKGNYIEFLEKTLKEIGLTDKESNDFITYWLPQMNEFPYCQISFQTENYEEAVGIDYSVAPNNELRVFATFKGLEQPIEILEQSLDYYENFERTGFTVVEWGGTFIE